MMGQLHEFVDTHAHLDEDVFGDDLVQVLEKASRAGVKAVVVPGTTAASSAAAVSLAGRWPQLYAAVGIQPNYGNESTAEDWGQIVELAATPRVRAIGETGLDAHWDYTPMPIQRDLFDKHIRLSQELDLPLIVHMRDCSATMVETLRVARKRGPLRGVMHSFSGDLATAQQCLDLGLFISFSGMITFKKSEQLRQVARHIPADRLLLESDSPYLTPHPQRGRRPNEPSLIVHAARCLSEAREVSLEKIAAETSANAHQLFGLE